MRQPLSRFKSALQSCIAKGTYIHTYTIMYMYVMEMYIGDPYNGVYMAGNQRLAWLR